MPEMLVFLGFIILAVILGVLYFVAAIGEKLDALLAPGAAA